MNLKKIGLTALAGSLVATSAIAGEMTISGGAKLSYTSHGGNDTTTTDVASGFAMDQEMAASGSGELDNGMVVTVTHSLAASGSTSDSSYLTLDMGDMGTLSYSDDDQHGGLASLDDMMPKAYEEADDGFSSTTTKNFAEMPSGQGFGYTTTVNNLGISVGYSDGIGAEAARTDGGQDTSASTNSSSSVALTYTLEDLGLTVFGGMGNEGQADGKELDHSTVGAIYAYGPVTVGYQTNSEEDSDSTATNTDLDTTIYSVAFNVNENLSLSYGEHNTEQEGATTDQEINSVQASYSMGGMTINLKDSEMTGTGNTANKNNETTEVLVTFAF